jgi:multidrug efflux system membrane fusion protein
MGGTEPLLCAYRKRGLRMNGNRRRLIGGVLLLTLLGAGVGWFVLTGDSRASRAAAPAETPVIPVAVATAEARDVPLERVGIGNVQALYSVLVRAQVTGYLDHYAVEEGQMVKKGDLLAVIDPRPFQAALDQARAQKAKDEANLYAAERDFQRYKILAQHEFQSWQNVDDQQGTVGALRASIKADEAAIEQAALNLEFAHITSPIDGRVGLRQIDPGNLVTANQSNGLITVTQVQPITAVFTLPERYLPEITEAMAKGPVKVRVFSADHHQYLAEGKLLTPDNQIDTSTGTIRLKAIFDNKDNRLWPGQYIEARVEVKELKGVTVVPEVAVERGAEGLFVFVVGPDHRVSVRRVEEATEQDGIAAISAGLKPGEVVVVNGQSRLAEGMAVAEHPADADERRGG